MDIYTEQQIVKRVKYMILFFLLIFLSVDVSFGADTIKKSAVTYTLNGGRFGDNLKSFIQSYWVAYKHDLSFLYVPFPGSDQLRMHTLLTHTTSEMTSVYKNVITFGRNSVPIITDFKGSLYITTFYCKAGINWHDTVFVQRLKDFIAPVDLLDIPADISTSIALHVRRGGGFSVDTDRARRRRPAHFPHISYYAYALNYLLSCIEGNYIVYLFTDDKDPHTIATEIEQELKLEYRARITLRYRVHDNRHDAHVLDDFFSLRNARYLIRPKSNFSLYAQKLGVHDIAIYPGSVKQGSPWGIVESIFVDYKNERQEILLS